MALALPEVTEGRGYGHRNWQVGGKAFVWERPLRKADVERYGSETPPAGPIVAITTEDLGEKAAILAEGTRGFFTISHFDGYPAVLVQLDVVTKRSLRAALVDGWLACAPADLADAYLRRSRRARRTG